MLTSLAGLIAQSLDRARLYDAKHTLAHSLQAGLLPQTLPRILGLEVAARYLPAGHGIDVGSDFYDLIRCAPAVAAAAIGDVQGRSTAAAALMGQVRTAVHAHASAGAPPGELLARTNRLLTDLDTPYLSSAPTDSSNHLEPTSANPPHISPRSLPKPTTPAWTASPPPSSRTLPPPAAATTLPFSCSGPRRLLYRADEPTPRIAPVRRCCSALAETVERLAVAIVTNVFKAGCVGRRRSFVVGQRRGRQRL